MLPDQGKLGLVEGSGSSSRKHSVGKADFVIGWSVRYCCWCRGDLSRRSWQIGPVGTPSPAIRYFDSGDLVLVGAGGVVCSG